jgi:hypothetical protein
MVYTALANIRRKRASSVLHANGCKASSVAEHCIAQYRKNVLRNTRYFFGSCSIVRGPASSMSF